MNCELCRIEMKTWRFDADRKIFEDMFAHLESCPQCSIAFERLSQRDKELRQTFFKIPESPMLESRILAGLRQDRAHAATPRRTWRLRFLLPIAAVLLLALGASLRLWVQDRQFAGEVAGLIRNTPSIQISSNNRAELLQWSERIIPGASQLSSRLERVEFRGAASVRVADHDAVWLKMKNENRASLVIFEGRLLHTNGIKTIQHEGGSEALWSDNEKTYALLFDGSFEEMRAYMNRMGIAS